MKLLRRLRIALSVAVILLTTTLLLFDSTLPGCYLLTIDVMRLSLGAVTSWLVATLLLGRVYCSSTCPIGTLQDAVSWVANRWHNHGHGNYRYVAGDWRLRIITALLLLVSVTSDTTYWNIGLLCDPAALWSGVVSLLHPAEAPAVWWQPLLGGVAIGLLLVLTAIVVMAWRGGRTFCSTVCPVGTALGAVSQYSLMQLQIDPDKCIACGACERECKACCVSAVQHTIDHSRCVMCLNCAASCPNKAITYRPGKHPLATPLMRRTTSATGAS